MNNSFAKYIIPIYIEKYSTPAGTFIYRQLMPTNNDFEKIIVTSSKTENLDKFPFPKIFVKVKNLPELLLIKFYEKMLRDKISFKYHKFLSPSQYFTFKKFLDNDKIKFVHAHYGTGGLEIYSLVKKLNKKLIISFHGYDAASLLNFKSYVNQMKNVIKNVYVIIPSENMKNRLENKIGSAIKSYVIHYGIPLEFFEKANRVPVSQKFVKQQKITFLQVSNFVEKKGHKYTIEAFARLLNKFKNIELILAGDGVTKIEMEKLTSELGVRNSIKFVGSVNQSEVKELMKDADIFVHHSLTASNGDQEGIPNVIIEAMATGLPVISTYHSGIPELIEDGVNGFMVTERDVDDYIIKIRKLLENNFDSMPAAARKTVEDRFNLDKQLIKLDQVYREVISS